jgi:hypothetical protein
MNEQQRAVVRRALDALTYINAKTTRDEDEIIKAITALRQLLEAEPSVTVRYDLSAADTEAAIRDKLIELGWTPPAQPAPVQEPESFEQWNAKQHGDPEEIGFLQALRIAYCAGQDSVTKTTPQAQPAAWVGLDGLEMSDLWLDTPFDDCTEETFEAGRAFIEAIEAKLREKNAPTQGEPK